MIIARKDIRPAVQAALNAAALFSTASVIAILDDGSDARDDEMRVQLRDRGAVIAIPPLLSSSNEDQTGDRLCERVTLRVDFRLNANVNSLDDKANLTLEEAEDAIIATLLRLGAVDGPLEGLRFNEERVTESIQDPGLVTKAVFCTVPVDHAAA